MMGTQSGSTDSHGGAGIAYTTAVLTKVCVITS